MKKMNRRAFLTLTGAALAMMALTACGADDVPPAPPAPPAPTTSEETKVLEAIKKYRAAAGVTEQITLEDDLKPAVKLVAEVAKGDKKYEDVIGELGEITKLYPDLSAPIGIAADKDTGNITPVCTYLEDVEKMALNLPSQVDDTAKEALKSARLIAIQLFEYGHAKYWVAVVSKGKVTP